MSNLTFYGLSVDTKKFDFDVSLDINGRLRQKSKDVMYMIIALFYHVLYFAFENGYLFKTFFSIIM